MKIMVFGGSGLLGKEFERRLKKDQVMSLSSKDMDISDIKGVCSIIDEVRPDVVINCAAIANPEICEKDPDLAYRVNSIGARNIAIACSEVGCKDVYLSTDHIFNGMKGSPYVEFDSPAPVNAYGRSKLAGENFTREFCSRYFIVRTSILFGIHRETLVTRSIKQAKQGEEIMVPKDQVVSPTYIKDLVYMIRRVVEENQYGIYHMTNSGFSNRYDLVKETLKLAGYPDAKVTAVPSDFTGKAVRPLNVLLRNYMLELTGKPLGRDWKEALQEFIKDEIKR